MKISIAMCTYNGTKYLQEQLDSIAAQTRLPDELVVCDDGSTDDTLNILNQFAATAPFKVLVKQNQQNVGSTENFFRTAKLCVGDLIAFSDQDDVWCPSKLAICEKYFTSDPDIVLVAHNACVTDAQLNSVRALWSHRTTLYKPLQLRLQDVLLPGFSLMFRRKLVNDVPILPWEQRPRSCAADYRMAHDEYLCFVAVALGKVALHNESLAYYRQHEHNLVGLKDVDQHGAKSTSQTSDAVRVSSYAQQLHTTSAEHYLGLAAVFESWADAYKHLSTTAPHDESLYLLEAEHHQRNIAEIYRWRALIYHLQTERKRRLLHLLQLMLRKGYKSRQQGGLGWKSFAKDAIQTFRSRKY